MSIQSLIKVLSFIEYFSKEFGILFYKCLNLKYKFSNSKLWSEGHDVNIAGIY